MPVPEWSNEGTELTIKAVLGKMLRFPLHIEGDYSASSFTGSWEKLDGTENHAFAVEAPVFPVTPEGELGDWTLVDVKYDALSIGQPQEEGDLYRYDMEMDGSPLLFGRLKVVADT